MVRERKRRLERGCHLRRGTFVPARRLCRAAHVAFQRRWPSDSWGHQKSTDMQPIIAALAATAREPAGPDVLEVGPSNFSLCMRPGTPGISALLLQRPGTDGPSPSLLESIRLAASQARQRVCHVDLGRSGPSALVSRDWRLALQAAIGDARADQLRRIVRQAGSRLVLLSGEGMVEYPLGAGGHLNLAQDRGLLDILARGTSPLLQAAGGASGTGEGRRGVIRLDATNFTRVAMETPLLLVAFTVRWCARCPHVTSQLQRAARLLPTLPLAVRTAIGVVDMDNPQNAGILRELGVASFPVGQLFHRRRLLGPYLKARAAR